MPGDPTQEQMRQIGDALESGQKILAIKLYREFTNSGLNEAKDFIDHLEVELRAARPDKFPATPARRAPAPAIWWFLWFFMIAYYLAMHFVFGKQFHLKDDPALGTALWYVSLVQVGLSTLNRWAILPHLRLPARMLVSFIFGLALSASLSFYSAMTTGEERHVLLALGLAGMIQYMPVFVNQSNRQN